MIAHLHLVWAEFGRDRTRTLLTLASIATAFFLFGLLDAARTGFMVAGETAHGAKRLMTSSRLSLTEPLPVALGERIAAVDGVMASAHASWFAGYYQHYQNPLTAYAVSDTYLDLYPEIEVDPWARREFQNVRNAVLVGEGVAHRFGWEVGQSIPVMSGLFFDQSGNNYWEVMIAGILRTHDAGQSGFYANLILLRWDFIAETSPYFDGHVGWYISNVRDTSHADQIARLIDGLSLNSSHETRTRSEQAVFAANIRQWVDVDLMTRSIMGAVFFSLLLIVSSVIVQSVRARRSELALLQALGFSRIRTGAMVITEAMLLLLIGGITGLVLAILCVLAANHLMDGLLALPAFSLNRWGTGVLLMVGLGFVTGLVSIIRPQQSKISKILSRQINYPAASYGVLAAKAKKPARQAAGNLTQRD